MRACYQKHYALDRSSRRNCIHLTRLLCLTSLKWAHPTRESERFDGIKWNVEEKREKLPGDSIKLWRKKYKGTQLIQNLKWAYYFTRWTELIRRVKKKRRAKDMSEDGKRNWKANMLDFMIKATQKTVRSNKNQKKKNNFFRVCIEEKAEKYYDPSELAKRECNLTK